MLLFVVGSDGQLAAGASTRGPGTAAAGVVGGVERWKVRDQMRGSRGVHFVEGRLLVVAVHGCQTTLEPNHAASEGMVLVDCAYPTAGDVLRERLGLSLAGAFQLVNEVASEAENLLVGCLLCLLFEPFKHLSLSSTPFRQLSLEMLLLPGKFVALTVQDEHLVADAGLDSLEVALFHHLPVQ